MTIQRIELKLNLKSIISSQMTIYLPSFNLINLTQTDIFTEGHSFKMINR